MAGADVYVVVAQTGRLPFIYVDTDLAPVTGKTNGDFTIEISKNGVGNQATTGCTISEIDATNNAGEYQLVCSAATSFVTVVGTYQIVVYDTATPTYRWQQTVRVANSNSFTGTTASFTATASDGRIYDGSNPVEDATVTLIDASGNRVTEVTSDASGLWGPVYLPASVTGYAQKTGYAQSNFTITVAGLVATGPGADITLSTSSSVNTLLASELVAYARYEAADRSGTKTDAVLLQIVNDAIQSTARKTNSTYYLSTYDIAIEATYSTGTLTLTNGSKTATLAGGTFPTNAIYGFIYEDSKVYEIDTRVSDTEVTLRTEYVGTTGAKTDWKWGRASYALPENLYQISSIYYGQGWPWKSEPQSYNDFIRIQQEYLYYQKQSWAWAIANKQIHLTPCPSSDDFITIVYYRRPAQITSLSDVADVDSVHLEFLRRIISYHVTLRYGVTEGGLSPKQCMQHAMDTLAETSHNDRNMQAWSSPMTRGGMGRINLTQSIRNTPAS